MEESSSYRDRVCELYKKCRCGNSEAYRELERLAKYSCHPSHEDGLVVNGYIGDLLLVCQSKQIPQDERRGKELLSGLGSLDPGSVTCPHLQHLLAVYYHDCCDDKEAETIELFRLASEQGHAMSTSTLGFFYDYGDGIVVRKDSKKSFSLYMQAALAGYPVAECNVGKCYDSGHGVEEDAASALEWFLKAAEQGYVDALYNVGIFYRIGRGTDKIYKSAAAKYFRLASEQGDASAQYNYGWCFHTGFGVEADSKEAFKWMAAAAEQRDAMACQFLGMAYENGWGVQVNIVESVRYYRKAVDIDPTLHFATTQLVLLAEAYKEEVWNNRKSFLLFLWGCDFIYRPPADGSVPQLSMYEDGDDPSNNAIHDTFYLHEMRHTIMEYL